jgi:phage tail sheath gpL-like
MSVYNNRDLIVKKGCSTVDLIAGRYQMQDFVTTYHPDGEEPPQFRYCRNIMLDFNVRYSYYLLEQIYVVNHVLIGDNDVVTATSIIQPKRWKAELAQLADNLVDRALVTDADFMTASITVEIGESNPDRLETFFRYKRTGIARISSTTAEAGFNLGS